jgi:hypothetical protein
MVTAGRQADYQRRQEQLMTQMNRQQTYSYGRTTICGITGGTIFNIAAVAAHVPRKAGTSLPVSCLVCRRLWTAIATSGR